METKKQKIVSAVATMGIVLMLFGTTYAYFAARGDAGKTTDVEITANTVDVLTFEIGDPISLSLDQENFASEKGNQSGSTFAKATLSANNKTNTATEHYCLYLSISNNTFTYSKDNSYPEILVKITDSDGNELVDSDVDGLTYKTVVDAQGNTVTGFDVTDKEGTITILSNREITTTSTKSETWTFTFTFVNYDFNQADNAGGCFSARVLIKKNGATLNDICKDGDELSDCIVAMYGIDSDFYHHDSTLENGAGDNSYRFSGGDSHEAYYTCTYEGNEVYSNQSLFDNNHSYKDDCESVYSDTESSGKYYDKSIYDSGLSVVWDSSNGVCTTVNGDAVKTSSGSLPSETECNGYAYYFYNDMATEMVKMTGASTAEPKNNASYVIKNLTNVGSGEETLFSEDNEDVKNYVCFGSDAEACPDDNLYRIIGVFDNQVKLIKADYATADLLGTDGDYSSQFDDIYFYYKGKNNNLRNIGTYFWSTVLHDETEYYNLWEYSMLNTINLNSNFISHFSNKWSDKIDVHTYIVGGNTNLNDVNSSIAYNYEITNPYPSTYLTGTYTNKIGLMYISDYGFASDPVTWTTKLSSYGYENTSSSELRDDQSVLLSLNNVKNLTIGNSDEETIYVNDLNWMYMGLDEWTITRGLYGTDAYFISYLGDVSEVGNPLNMLDRSSVNKSYFAVRPVFYLKSNITYVSGFGTKSNPVIIK